MGRLLAFSTSFTWANAGGNSDIFSIQPADDYPVKLRKVIFGQSTEIAEAQEEAFRFRLARLAATFTVGSGGAAVTGYAVREGDGTTGTPTVRANDTTIATTSGEDAGLEEWGWNLRATPLVMEWSSEDAPVARQASGLVLQSPGTPTDDITAELTIIVEI